MPTSARHTAVTCYKNHGLLASLFPAYNKELVKWREIQSRYDAEKDSVYVGEVKDRITVKITSLKCITSWETQFGVTFLYKMVTGTVKAHTEFKGIKQTELTRCRVAA